MTIIDDIAPYLLTLILFFTAILVTRMFKITNFRVILLSAAMLELLFTGVTGNFGVAIAVFCIVLVFILMRREQGSGGVEE